MVFDGTAAQVAVDEAKVDVNREIIRKMQELGYYDEDEVMVEKFKLQGYDWIKENQDAAAPCPRGGCGRPLAVRFDTHAPCPFPHYFLR